MMYSEEKSKAALEKGRRPDGKFAPGVSGNKKGRPKKPKSDDLPPNFHEIVGSDSKKAFETLLSTATSRYEAAKLADKLLKFQYPTLSSVESFATEVKTIEVKWIADDDPVQVIEHNGEETGE